MIKKLLILLFLVHLSLTVFSDPPGGGGPVDCDLYPDDPQCYADEVPLDGGTGLLILAGVAYGVKRLRDKKTNPVRI